MNEFLNDMGETPMGIVFFTPHVAEFCQRASKPGFDALSLKHALDAMRKRLKKIHRERGPAEFRDSFSKFRKAVELICK